MNWLKYLFGFLIAALAIAACNPESQMAAPKPASPPVAAATDVDPAAYRGAAVAGQVCSRCHDVGLGLAPVLTIDAPAFREIAGRRESTPEGLAAWMKASHPAMPNYLFDGPDVADLAAFILSLQQTPG